MTAISGLAATITSSAPILPDYAATIPDSTATFPDRIVVHEISLFTSVGEQHNNFENLITLTEFQLSAGTKYG